MDAFRRFAVFTIARDAAFVALAASTLMVAFSFAPPLAFSIGAHIALAFSIVLLLRAQLLTEDGFRRSEVWQALEDEAEQHLAREEWQVLLLQSAKTAAAFAITFYSSSLLSALGGPEPAHALMSASLN